MAVQRSSSRPPSQASLMSDHRALLSTDELLLEVARKLEVFADPSRQSPKARAETFGRGTARPCVDCRPACTRRGRRREGNTPSCTAERRGTGTKIADGSEPPGDQRGQIVASPSSLCGGHKALHKRHCYASSEPEWCRVCKGSRRFARGAVDDSDGVKP